MSEESTDKAAPDAAGPTRGELVRDAAVLQLKLAIDGLRDLLLIPATLVAAVISLLRSGDRPGTEFYDLLKLGKQSESWINLFGALRRVDPDYESGADVDRVVDQVEQFIRDEYREGHITRQAREKLEKAVDTLQRAAVRSPLPTGSVQEPPRPSSSSSDRGA